MARTDNLTNFLTDVADAIRTKTGSTDPIQASSFDTAIENIPSGSGTPIQENDVNFYDYDGDLLYSYSKEQFLNLTEMPENIVKSGFISQGWNWTLEDAQDYVNEYGVVDVGQLVKTSDNKIHIFITLDNINKSPYLGFAISGTAIVDWGDGTNEEIVGTSTTTLIQTQHNYEAKGKYEITISSSSKIYFLGAYDKGTYLLLNTNDTSSYQYSNNPYLVCVDKIYLNDNCSLGVGAFRYLYNLASINLQNDTDGNWYYTLANTGIKMACMPIRTETSSQTTYLRESLFRECSALELAIANKTSYYYYSRGAEFCAAGVFYKCSALKRLYLPNGARSDMGSSSNLASASLQKIIIPRNVSNISNTIFEGGTMEGLKEIVFPSTLTKITATNWVKSSIPSIKILDFSRVNVVVTLSGNLPTLIYKPTLRIIVPDNLYDDWITTQYWSDIASNIIKASDYFTD